MLTSVNIVLVAMRSMWQQVHTLLTRAAELARDPEDRTSCKIAALMAHELAHPEQIDSRRDINRRIMALKQDRRTRAELIGDEQLKKVPEVRARDRASDRHRS
ncbi:hypothetical protein [Nocardia abscessus]|uniref:hypothetical protein n=1 Tax=Nocardia abscessus TaxID=120957 RepID=UPI002455EBC9|nr:hypothetical protein [Nocardia abscessus]